MLWQRSHSIPIHRSPKRSYASAIYGEFFRCKTVSEEYSKIQYRAGLCILPFPVGSVAIKRTTSHYYSRKYSSQNRFSLSRSKQSRSIHAVLLLFRGWIGEWIFSIHKHWGSQIRSKICILSHYERSLFTRIIFCIEFVPASEITIAFSINYNQTLTE